MWLDYCLLAAAAALACLMAWENARLEGRIRDLEHRGK